MIDWLVLGIVGMFVGVLLALIAENRGSDYRGTASGLAGGDD